jgi:PleD family two-component response regulator
VGFTFSPNNTTLEADDLLRQADHAMYKAKIAGKNRYHLFGAD